MNDTQLFMKDYETFLVCIILVVLTKEFTIGRF
jgi:hypothetical protein